MNDVVAPLVWTPRDRRLFRGFMVLTGLGLIVPALIYLFSWPDAVNATALALGQGVAPFVTAGTIVAHVASASPPCRTSCRNHNRLNWGGVKSGQDQAMLARLARHVWDLPSDPGTAG